MNKTIFIVMLSLIAFDCVAFESTRDLYKKEQELAVELFKWLPSEFYLSVNFPNQKSLDSFWGTIQNNKHCNCNLFPLSNRQKLQEAIAYKTWILRKINQYGSYDNWQVKARFEMTRTNYK